MREAVCDPHCPLTEKGRVKWTLGAEPLSPGALASRATLTKGRRRGGGGGGDRGRLFSRRSAGAKRGLGSRGPGAPCSCEGGASRPASWGPPQQGAAPAPGPCPPHPPPRTSIRVRPAAPLAGQAGSGARPAAARHGPAATMPPVPSTAPSEVPGRT